VPAQKPALNFVLRQWRGPGALCLNEAAHARIVRRAGQSLGLHRRKRKTQSQAADKPGVRPSSGAASRDVCQMLERYVALSVRTLLRPRTGALRPKAALAQPLRSQCCGFDAKAGLIIAAFQAAFYRVRACTGARARTRAPQSPSGLESLSRARRNSPSLRCDHD